MFITCCLNLLTILIDQSFNDEKTFILKSKKFSSSTL